MLLLSHVQTHSSSTRKIRNDDERSPGRAEPESIIVAKPNVSICHVMVNSGAVPEKFYLDGLLSNAEHIVCSNPKEV
jgi:hypothetical protein